MINKKIAIIGAGNLGSSIARGMVTKGIIDPENLTITNISTDLLTGLKDELGVNITTDNHSAIKESDIVFIAVKPYVAIDLINSLKESFVKGKHVLASVVSGIKLKEIEDILPDIPVVRVMPNTALSVCQSMTAISVSEKSAEYEGVMKEIFDQLGESFVVPESQMPAATVLASCGIAFALRFMRATAQAGIEIGFSSALSHKIAAQIMQGAAELIKSNGTHPEEEIDRVTTPMGVTISSLNSMEHEGFSASLVHGVNAGFKKIKETES
jgi:pyrroline-5-carboxylate reductase